jgi:hypothetical protein
MAVGSQGIGIFGHGPVIGITMVVAFLVSIFLVAFYGTAFLAWVAIQGTYFSVTFANWRSRRRDGGDGPDDSRRLQDDL